MEQSSPNKIDVHLVVPVDCSAAALAALVLRALDMLDMVKAYVDDPDTKITTEQAEETLYIQGAASVGRAIKERACAAAAKAFVAEFSTEETIQDLKGISLGV